MHPALVYLCGLHRLGDEVSNLLRRHFLHVARHMGVDVQGEIC